LPIELAFPYGLGHVSINEKIPLFPYIEAMSDEISLEVLMPINDQIQEKMVSILSSGKGIPPDGIGGLMRMLYFSVTTITTLGLGDIVPISDRARLAVISESILGIILIGLFVNALTKEK